MGEKNYGGYKNSVGTLEQFKRKGEFDAPPLYVIP